VSSYVELLPGDPGPWFRQRSCANPRYAFDAAAGRYLVLCFFGSAAWSHSRAALDAVRRHPELFDDATASYFGVSLDPADEAQGRVADSYPGYRFFWDFDATAARLYGAVPRDVRDGPEGLGSLRPRWVVLDPTLRVLDVLPFASDASDIDALLALLRQLPPPSHFAGMELQAPVLVLPRVFEPAFCQRLIQLYERHGGEESGFMREVAGKTVLVSDPRHKKRRDHVIDDKALIAETQARVRRRVVPEIQKVHQFRVTRMERYIVSCYAAEDEGHFRPHRDNTTKGTAHRRFAVSINLNADYEGGDLSFPEYGPRRYKVPAGGAVVFSCSLLHAVSKVTRGRRYAFLPFLYDDAAARIREANNAFLDEQLARYRPDAAADDGRVKS
jgi:predicted 2-oxoglutarate/Fe(II)-dependent dioxygenase YbiX/peroxiredoxin